MHSAKGWKWVVGFYRSIDACARLADRGSTVEAVDSHCMYYYYYVMPAGETEFTLGEARRELELDRGGGPRNGRSGVGGVVMNECA